MSSSKVTRQPADHQNSNHSNNVTETGDEGLVAGEAKQTDNVSSLTPDLDHMRRLLMNENYEPGDDITGYLPAFPASEKGYINPATGVKIDPVGEAIAGTGVIGVWSDFLQASQSVNDCESRQRIKRKRSTMESEELLEKVYSDAGAKRRRLSEDGSNSTQQSPKASALGEATLPREKTNVANNSIDDINEVQNTNEIISARQCGTSGHGYTANPSDNGSLTGGSKFSGSTLAGASKLVASIATFGWWKSNDTREREK